MKIFPKLCVLSILAMLTNSVFAQTTVAWKLKEGDVFYVQQIRNSEQKLTVQESLIRQELKSTSVSQFKVVQHADGKLVLQQKIESFTVSTGQDNSAVKELLMRLTGASLTFHLDGKFNIIKVEGHAELVKNLTKGDTALEKTALAVLPEAAFREAVVQLFDFVPKKPVEKGTAWETDAVETFGPLGIFKITDKWSFGGSPEPDTAKIAGTQKIVLDITQANKSLPFQIKAGVVKKTEAETEVLFNLAKGRLHKRTLKRQLQLQFLIEKDKQTLDMFLAQNASVTLEVLDKNPAKK